MNFQQLKTNIIFILSEIEENGYTDDERLVNAVYQSVRSDLKRLSTNVPITIPSYVREIKEDYFDKFEKAEKINRVRVMSKTPPVIHKNSFAKISEDAVYEVRRGTLETFKNATNWSVVADNILEDRK